VVKLPRDAQSHNSNSGAGLIGGKFHLSYEQDCRRVQDNLSHDYSGVDEESVQYAGSELW
jgi:hypothetical protein